MTEEMKKCLLGKNQNLIDMVIEKAKRDFPEDIAIVGLTGSFSTGDFHEKSDLDLIIINNTQRGWKISKSFIYDDVGYDIYCTPWETRIEEEANLESPGVSSLLEMKILYYAKPEDLEKLRSYQQRARKLLAEPIGESCIYRGEKSIVLAKQSFAQMMLEESIGSVRYYSSEVMYHLVNSIVALNNTYLKRGIKRYFEEISAYRYLPENFEGIYWNILRSRTVTEIRATTQAFLKSVISLSEKMRRELVPSPKPTKENMRGTYEELWSNYRNKVMKSAEEKDLSYAYWTAMGAQNFLNEMTKENGTPKFDLMARFDPKYLGGLKKAFEEIAEEYRKIYDTVGLSVEKFSTFEELYRNFMEKKE
jgi:predicted nucleotidyltransferase